MQQERKVAIVTGASRGIGEAIARHLAQLGYHVVMAARNEADLQSIAQDLNDQGLQAYVQKLDVADHRAIEKLVIDTVERFGKIDLLVNNAGLIDPIARIGDSDPEAWSQIVDINLKGVYYGLRYVIPVMEKQKSGTIINISSGAANSFLEGWSHYCATKAGVYRLTGVAHKEYGDKGVRVFGLSPGTVATNMQKEIAQSGINPVSQLPWESHISPDWVAKAVEYLLTPDADQWLGTDFSLKTEEGRKCVGMT
jgi:3-oxoacyl-[acyl-carrier protein] reductase